MSSPGRTSRRRRLERAAGSLRALCDVCPDCRASVIPRLRYGGGLLTLEFAGHEPARPVLRWAIRWTPDLVVVADGRRW